MVGLRCQSRFDQRHGNLQQPLVGERCAGQLVTGIQVEAAHFGCLYYPRMPQILHEYISRMTLLKKPFLTAKNSKENKKIP
jgi:hypothetical protein